MSASENIESLRAEVERLKAELEAERARKVVKRPKIDEMSSEVVDSNPYRCAEAMLSDALPCLTQILAA